MTESSVASSSPDVPQFARPPARRIGNCPELALITPPAARAATYGETNLD